VAVNESGDDDAEGRFGIGWENGGEEEREC